MTGDEFIKKWEKSIWISQSSIIDSDRAFKEFIKDVDNMLALYQRNPL